MNNQLSLQSIPQLDKDHPLFQSSQILMQKKAKRIILIDLAELQSFFEFFLIASVDSRLQLASVSKAITEHFRLRRVSRDQIDSGWVCIDFFSSVTHLFVEEQRKYYNFERLWGDGNIIDVVDCVEQTGKKD